MDEPDERTRAEHQLERAMEKLEKHRPHIARRLRTMWNKEMAAMADIEAAASCDPYYADTPDMANEDAGPMSSLWHRFRRWRLP